MRAAITFDFHNTLIRCDPWFDLEVSRLPAEVARALEASANSIPTTLKSAVLTDTYCALRSEIIAHGNELDAIEGVLETFRRLGVTVSVDEIAEIVDSLFRPLVRSSVVVDGVKDTLEHLRSRDVLIGVVSSAVHHDFLEWTLDHHGLSRYFDDVVTSASSGFYKSRPEIFLTACDRLGTSPEQTVHVGDSFRFDHLGGYAAGLRTVWINHAGDYRAESGPEPTLELTSLVGAGPRIHDVLMASTNAH